jgi:hypothetical protein
MTDRTALTLATLGTMTQKEANLWVSSHPMWRHNTQHNDTQHNDIQNNNKKRDIQHNDRALLCCVIYAECHI